MATVMAGPSALTPLCKTSVFHCSYSSSPSHPYQKWVPHFPLFQNFSRAINVQKSRYRKLCRTGLALFTSWDVHAHLGESILLNAARKGFRRKGRRGVVQASLFGVGAPEALVIGVVALLVFGPKGLAEVARTLGRSLRAFQPTIKELQEVSREFKSTLEQEIGLDEFRASTIETPKSASQTLEHDKMEQNGPPGGKAYSTEDYLRVTEDEITKLVPEEKLKKSEGAELGGSPSPTISPQQTEEDGKEKNDKVV